MFFWIALMEFVISPFEFLNIFLKIQTLKTSTYFMKKILISLFLTLLSLSLFAQSDTSQSIFDLDIESLMNIKVITASKSAESIQDAPAVMTIVTAKEIEAFGAMKLWEVLDRLTSTCVMGSHFSPQGMVTIRGKITENYNTKILILMDGRPMRESVTGGYNHIIYDMFPVNQIDRIEVIRGPGSVLYGTNAYVGAINIITKKGADNNISAAIKYGTFNTTQLQVGINKKKKDLEIAFGANLLYSDGWDYTARGEKDIVRNKANNADSLLKNPTTISRADKGVGATLKLGYKGFTFNNFFAKNVTTSMGRLPLWSVPPEYKIDNTRILSDLGYTKELTKKLSLNANLTYNHLAYKNFGPGSQDDYLRRQSNDLLFEISANIKPVSNLNVVVGGLTNYQTGNAYQVDLTSKGQSVNVITTHNPDPWVSVPEYSVLWYSAYAQADYTPLKFLKLIAGGQINKITDIKMDFVPRLGAILSYNEHLGLKLLYGQAFRASTAFERSSYSPGSVYGNPLLTPEKITTYEAQVYYTNARVSAAFTVFSSYDDNIISRQNVKDTLLINGARIPFSQKYINTGSQTSNGVELEAKANVVKWLSLYGSATYMTTFDDAARHDYDGLPNLMTKLGFIVNYREKLTLGVYGSYYGSGGNYYVYSNTGVQRTSVVNPAADPYTDISANINANLKNIFKADMRDVILQYYVTNLLNAEIYYPETVRRNINSLPGRAGRAFNFGVLIKI